MIHNYVYSELNNRARLVIAASSLREAHQSALKYLAQIKNDEYRQTFENLVKYNSPAVYNINEPITMTGDLFNL